MLTDDAHAKFPIGTEFLDLQERALDQAAEATEQFSRTSGQKLPASVQGLGTVLSLMYRAACCAWGCSGGDHQLEWLVGRVVNQGTAAYRLICAASYDESLMLIRGIGEVANLLWLVQASPPELQAWAASSRRERLTNYGPVAVRRKLEQLQQMGPPIDEARYQKLCEVGTHPVPNLPPSHFTGSGRPVLSGLVQPVGIYVCVTELAFAVAMCGTPTATVIIKAQQPRQELFNASFSLIQSLGAFTILNYEELLANTLRGEFSEGSAMH